MTIFEQLTQAVAGHDTCWAAFQSARQQGNDIINAVAARIAADRTAADERTAALVAQSRDPARPEVVQRLALQELERLQKRTFEPSADEVAAFSVAMDDAEAALRDFSATKVKLRELFEAANQQLKTLRGDTLGSGHMDPELARKWLDGEERSFALLGKTGRPGGTS